MTAPTADTGMLVLNRADLEGMGVTWPEIIDVLDDAFVQKSQGQVQNPPKPKVAPRSDAFINAMPAYLGGSDRAGIKWVAGYEQNRTKGLPYIYGVLVMTDAETGRPIALVDGGWVTEKRTAAASGVTMRHVQEEPRTLAVIGCGVQGRAHLDIAVHSYPGLEQVRVYDHTLSKAEAMADLAGGRELYTATSETDALAGADLVITTVTRPMDPKLDCSGTSEDALILPVDYDDAIATSVFNDASFFAVDDLGQYSAVGAKSSHFAGFREPDAELAAIVAGHVEVPAEGRRVIMNMGIATEDVALGGLLYDRAVAEGVGRWIDFP
jgi:ornithine cyclodeaminase/alanine dehydrogenase-like protein (mu-crystallin family)